MAEIQLLNPTIPSCVFDNLKGLDTEEKQLILREIKAQFMDSKDKELRKDTVQSAEPLALLVG